MFGIGPGRHRQDLPRDGQGRAGAAGQAGQPHHPDPARGRGGERLGFLPGTLYEKIDPYLRPLYDALHDMIDPESIPRLMAAGTIEVAPLAYMRGRTLNDAFIILDEAQNTSPEQMKMFLTRLGFGSKIVVTGDVTQVDLPTGTKSGLRVVQDILDGIEDVHFTLLTRADVVRHRLVSDIVDAYARYDAEERGTRDSAGAPAPAAAALTAERERSTSPTSRRRGRRRAALVDPVARHVLDRAGRRTRWPSCRCCSSTSRRWSRLHVRTWTSPGRPTCSPSRWTSSTQVDDDDETTPRPTLLGDVVLCPEVAERQAIEAGHAPRRRAAPAVHARHPAPARLRPRRAEEEQAMFRVQARAARRRGAPGRAGRRT